MKILILNNMFIKDLEKDFNYFIDKLKNNKFDTYSPVTITKKKNDFFNLVSSILTLEEELKDKDFFIYFGPATKNIKFDKIFCINENLVSTQEVTLENTILKVLTEKTGILREMHKSSTSFKNFKDVDECVNYINNL